MLTKNSSIRRSDSYDTTLSTRRKPNSDKRRITLPSLTQTNQKKKKVITIPPSQAYCQHLKKLLDSKLVPIRPIRNVEDLRTLGHPVNLFSPTKESYSLSDTEIQKVMDRKQRLQSITDWIKTKQRAPLTKQRLKKYLDLCKAKTQTLVERMHENDYHTINHFNNLCTAISKLPIATNIKPLIMVMAYYHDAVQDKGPCDNEIDSLKELVKDMIDYNLPATSALSNVIGKIIIEDATEMMAQCNGTVLSFIYSLYQHENTQPPHELFDILFAGTAMSTSDLFSSCVIYDSPESIAQEITPPFHISRQLLSIISTYGDLFIGPIEQGIKMMIERRPADSSSSPLKKYLSDFRKKMERNFYSDTLSNTFSQETFNTFKEELLAHKNVSDIKELLLNQLSDLTTFWYKKESYGELKAFAKAYGMTSARFEELAHSDNRRITPQTSKLEKHVIQFMNSTRRLNNIHQKGELLIHEVSKLSEENKTDLCVYLMWIAANRGKQVSSPGEHSAFTATTMAHKRLHDDFSRMKQEAFPSPL